MRLLNFVREKEYGESREGIKIEEKRIFYC